jgi:glucosylceramidase
MKKSFSQVLLVGFITLNLCGSVACGKKSTATPVTPTKPTEPTQPTTSDVAMWLTNPDQSQAFMKQNVSINFGTSAGSGSLINIDAATTYQTIDGFWLLPYRRQRPGDQRHERY